MESILKLLIDLKGAQLLLSLVIWGAIAYLAATQQAIPDALVMAGTATLAFWFGITATQRVNGGSG